jgi:hypothetical protein
VIDDAARRHAVQCPDQHAKGAPVPGAAVVARQELERSRPRELRCAAEPTPCRVEGRLEVADAGPDRAGVRRVTRNVALGRTPLVRDLIAAKELVVPFQRSADPARAYFVIVAPGAAARSEVGAFVAWLRREAAVEDAKPSG